MAYENTTYEVILNRMMDRVRTDYPNIDTREGSIIFNALAPAALELAIMYTELDNVLTESFVATASRGGILLGCQQMGMDIMQFAASFGTHKGLFNIKVPISSRWNCDLYNYTVTEYIGEEGGKHAYKMECETAGSEPNSIIGDLTAITDMPNGLESAELVECIIEGEDTASDNEIRKAYFEFVNSTVTDGNVNQYERWCSEYDGVGHYKVFPLWNGDNTVKVSILSTSNRAASEELVAEFQEYLDPGSKGMGDGAAPIGAFVTVTTATELPINVSATVKMQSGYTDTTPIATALNDYFSSIAYEKSVVAYMNVGAVILGVKGVDSISNLKINNGTADINIADEQIPVLGTTNWTVS